MGAIGSIGADQDIADSVTYNESNEMLTRKKISISKLFVNGTSL